MGRPKGSKNKVKRVRVQIPCKTCGSMEPHKFRFKLQLCATCDNVRWWQTNKDKCNKSELRKQSKAKWDTKNAELIKQRDAARYIRDKEQILARKRERKDIINKQYKERYKTDPQFKLKSVLRKRLKHALQKDQKTGSAVDDLGCTVDDLKKHLESKFQPGMTWENQGQWHIDHIRPLDSFDLTDRAQLLEACNYTNLQPLWAEDNLRKGNKYE